MNNETRTTLVLSRELTDAVDDHWYSERLRSRPDAIRDLLIRALSAKLATAKPAKEQRR